MNTSVAVKMALLKFNKNSVAKPLTVDGGEEMAIQRVLVDAGWQTKSVFKHGPRLPIETGNDVVCRHGYGK